jgi:hypothetical protein
MSTLFRVIAVLSVAAACSTGSGSGGASGLPRIGQPSADEQSCSRDQDCTLVDDCCGCAAGGSRTAVRADAVESLETQAAAQCGERTCAEGIASNHRSCEASAAICRGGRCIPQL